jgi:hypothetical protein
LTEVEVASALVKLLLSVFVGSIGDDLRSPIVCEAHIHTKGQAGHDSAQVRISFCLSRGTSGQALELYKNKSAAEMRLKADTAPTHRYELIKIH